MKYKYHKSNTKDVATTGAHNTTEIIEIWSKHYWIMKYHKSNTYKDVATTEDGFSTTGI
jgi:hypothetical protein